MVDLITVRVTEVRPLYTADGDLHEVTIRDPDTGTAGTVMLSRVELRDALGDAPTAELIAVDRARIRWKPEASGHVY
jgi:hypothetical protein